MKNFTPLTIFLIFLLSCSTNSSKKKHNSQSMSTDTTVSSPNGQVQNLTTDPSQEIDNSDKFLKLFQNLNPIGLHIYFPSNSSPVKVSGCIGIPIDVNKFSYFNNQDIFENIEPTRKGFYKIYAVGKINLNDKYYGLIFRQRSQYFESLIELMLWDKRGKIITKGIPLADSYGDAGWYFEKESWISTFHYNKGLTIITRRKDFTPKYLDNGSFDPTLFKITDTLKIIIFIDSIFVTEVPKNIDSTLYILTNWK